MCSRSRFAWPLCQVHFALRSDDDVEVSILGGDIVMRRGSWLARMVRESCPTWLQEVLLVRERRLPMALAMAHYMGGVLRIYRLGQPWVVLEGVSDHYAEWRGVMRTGVELSRVRDLVLKTAW